MPDPREAIYDVLKAKWQRAQDERARRREQAAWDAYEAANAQAEVAYRNQTARDATKVPEPR